MKMKYKDYLITSSQQGDRFDLQKIEQAQRVGTGTPHAPNGEFYNKSKDVGYDYKFDWLCNAIISLELEKKSEITSLEKYLEEYKLERLALEDFWLNNKPEQDSSVITITVEEYNKLKTLYDSIHSDTE